MGDIPMLNSYGYKYLFNGKANALKVADAMTSSCLRSTELLYIMQYCPSVYR